MSNLIALARYWWQKGVIYQIYPRSFQDSNGDGIGDLQGIISRLDYLNDGTPQSLGIDAIWISPCYPSPMVDFGYDISNYKDIDPIFGTLEDFKRLIFEAHRRNIKIIMDLVINHTSDQHPWFIESRQSRTNPKRDWYIWHPGINGRPPNNWFAAFELKSAWWWDEQTREFYLGTFTRHQPEVNWRNPELKEAMFDVIRFWLDLGVDGYRMDVVNWYIKDRQWRSNPWHLQLNPPDIQRHIYDRDQPETHDICREIRRLVDTYENRMLVGEIYTGDTQTAADYYGDGDELHLAFNFSFLFQKWNATGFHQQIEKWNRSMSARCWPNYTLSNHDQVRHYSRYGLDKWKDARAKVAAALLLTLRGTPFLYYGEEIGMSNCKIPKKQRRDPLGIKAWMFLEGRDGERTPMQWDDTDYAGFSKTAPWLPVHPNFALTNVQKQMDDSQSLFCFYRNLIWLRKNTPALAIGDYNSLIPNPKKFMAYKRSTYAPLRHEGKRLGNDTVYVVLNFTPTKLSIDLSHEIGVSKCCTLFGTLKKEGEEVDTASLTLAEYEAILLISL